MWFNNNFLLFVFVPQSILGFGSSAVKCLLYRCSSMYDGPSPWLVDRTRGQSDMCKKAKVQITPGGKFKVFLKLRRWCWLQLSCAMHRPTLWAASSNQRICVGTWLLFLLSRGGEVQMVNGSCIGWLGTKCAWTREREVCDSEILGHSIKP